MPYITEGDKQRLNDGPEFARTAGELTYLVTYHILSLPAYDECLDTFVQQEIDAYIEYHHNHDGVNYAVLASVIGSLECARREYQRRRPDDHMVANYVLKRAMDSFYKNVIAPYEDIKIEQNGDVF